MADSGDKGVREGALTFIGEIYKILDEQIWRLMGPVNIKVKGLLEGRFKQVKKGGDPMNRSINQATPPPELITSWLEQTLLTMVTKYLANLSGMSCRGRSNTSVITWVNAEQISLVHLTMASV